MEEQAPVRALSVNWPTGVGARGSSGVSAALSQTQGGITYVDVAFSLVNHFKFAKVKNKAGVFQTPGLRGINAAGQSIKKVGVANTGLSVVNPAKMYSAGLPDLHVRLHDRSASDLQGARREEVPAVGADEGPGRRPEAAVRSDPEGRAERPSRRSPWSST